MSASPFLADNFTSPHMTPVYQTRRGMDGNCLQAALASLLDMPLDAAPDFVNAPDAARTWPVEFDKWIHAKGFELEALTITCERKDVGRTVALCRADGADLSAAMVRAGWALAFVRYTRDYVEQEREAKAARAGLHAHDCSPPREWRAHAR